MGLILLIVAILLLFGGLGGPYIGAPWATGYGLGMGGNGFLILIVIIVIVLVFTGRL